MKEAINNRYEFVLLFDVKDGNPNGDPDAGNLPRIDPETGHGLVTDVCLKRKVRNYVAIVEKEQPPYEIYIKEKAVLTNQQEKAYKALGLENSQNASVSEQTKSWMCKNFYDVRTFGAVMLLKDFNCGQVRGPVQLGFARSIEQIVPAEHSITRMAVATQREADQQGGDNRTMGRKFTVPYALYRVHGFVSAPLAEQTGFSEKDLDLFWNALMNMFDHDRSAARGEMNPRKLIVFRHASELGNAPAQRLFDAVCVTRREGSTGSARSFGDYEVKIAKDAIPEGVELIEKL